MFTSSSTTVQVLAQVGSAPNTAISTWRACPSYCWRILTTVWSTNGWQVTSRMPGSTALARW